MDEEMFDEVKNDFPKYEKLLSLTKNSVKQTIILDEVKGGHPVRIKSVEVYHPTLDEKLKLTIESKIKNKRDFKFKLIAPKFSPKPFFRFDSDGQAHYNRVPGVELERQKIDTPHFHRFGNDGRNYAYKTLSLQTEGDCEALMNDINLCMAHYSDESSTFYENTSYLNIIQTPPTELDFGNDFNDNPTEGVEYE